MLALTVEPGLANSARLDKVAMPPAEDGAVLVRTLCAGICGTDFDITAGKYGQAPPGQQRLIIGHEAVGVVEEAPPGCGLSAGDLVVGIVRRPDPLPCAFCAAGEWDMCSNGGYTERGIKARNGYCSEFFRIEPDFAVRVEPALGDLGVLLEPASVLAKAWEHAEQIGSRSTAWQARTLLVTGAGPVGLLAALSGVQRGLDVHVFDRVTEGPKPQLVRDLGASYHAGELPAPEDLEPDIVMECTGAASVIVDAICRTAASGITCLAGMSSGQHCVDIDINLLNRKMVLENDVVFGSVNANRSHYEQAARDLAQADHTWLEKLVSRRVPLTHWRAAFERQADDVKVVLDFTR